MFPSVLRNKWDGLPPSLSVKWRCSTTVWGKISRMSLRFVKRRLGESLLL